MLLLLMLLILKLMLIALFVGCSLHWLMLRNQEKLIKLNLLFLSIKRISLFLTLMQRKQILSLLGFVSWNINVILVYLEKLIISWNGLKAKFLFSISLLFVRLRVFARVRGFSNIECTIWYALFVSLDYNTMKDTLAGFKGRQ